MPGKVIETDGNYGKVDIGGNLLKVALGVVDAKVGDYVLVHAGCAISVLSMDEKEEIEELLSLMREMDEETDAIG
jgi:hydrogenase expression/formation protein HypC